MSKKNPVSEKYEPIQEKLISKVSNINKKISKAIKNSNVKTKEELMDFLTVYINIEFESIRESTKKFLGVIKKDVKEISKTNNVGENKEIQKTMLNQTYIELNSNLVCAEKDTMQNFRKAIEPFKNKSTHITDIKNALQEEFVKNGGTTIKYKNGAKVNLDKYFIMATRTARTETQNATAIDNAIKLGTDYVYLSPVNSSCKLCSQMGNRVYSISGKDSGYPSLYGNLFKKGYTCIHPHCRCIVQPYFMEHHSKEEIVKIKNSSNRDFELDMRSEKDREQYQKSQAFNHNQWVTHLKFEKTKEVYGEQDMPYKKLSDLRRAKTMKTEKYYQKVVKMNIDNKQYQHWLDKLGPENMPSTLAKFQEMKYNENKIEYNRKQFAVYVEDFKDEINKEKEKRLRILRGQQEKHIKGTKNYENEEKKGEDKSYFLESLDLKDIQNIANKYATKGKFIENGAVDKGEFLKYKDQMQELIICDEYIGYCKNFKNVWILTNRAKIYYAKKGIHLAPTLKEMNIDD